MVSNQTNAVYVSHGYPFAAMLANRAWVRRIAAYAEFTLFRVIQPTVRNHQWTLLFARSRPGFAAADFREDGAPSGKVITPPMAADAHLFGLAKRLGFG